MVRTEVSPAKPFTISYLPRGSLGTKASPFCHAFWRWPSSYTLKTRQPTTATTRLPICKQRLPNQLTSSPLYQIISSTQSSTLARSLPSSNTLQLDLIQFLLALQRPTSGHSKALAAMAGSPVKQEPRHIKPDPGADADPDDARIDASIPAAEDFKDDAGQAAGTRETNYIEQLVSHASIEELEAGVQVGVQLLDSLKPPLQAALVSGETQASNWLESITRLQDEAKPARTVVGVVYVSYFCYVEDRRC